MRSGRASGWTVPRRRFGWISHKRLRQLATAAMAQVGLDAIDPDTRVGELGIGLFEFARAWWGGVAPMRRDLRIEGLEQVYGEHYRFIKVTLGQTGKPASGPVPQ